MARKKVAAPEAEKKDIKATFEMCEVVIPVKGITSLIEHKFSQKAGAMLKEAGEIEAGLKQGKKKKNIANPQEDYENSIHYVAGTKTYGFPATGFKMAMVDAAFRHFEKKKADVMSSFYVLGDKDFETVEIKGTPRLREDMVRIGGIQKVASPRYRAEFPEWSANVRIRFVKNSITEEELAKFLAAAGQTCGIGEWRPQKGGIHGMWVVGE